MMTNTTTHPFDTPSTQPGSKPARRVYRRALYQKASLVILGVSLGAAALRGGLEGLELHLELGPEALLLWAAYVASLAMRLVRLSRDRDPGANGEVRLDWPFTQSDLAAMIGGTRQSVNKLLSQLVDDGLLVIEHDTLVINDLNELAERAER